ncbi:MAG TPA: four helix bundle protein [Terriglobia bacterium]|nr:four helix bundle protein [Terriglobia bacterium]
MQHFTELSVWQRSHALVLSLYRLTSSFPADERFGLTSQLRRAVASVPTNIAEGAKRTGKQDYARFLNIAQGSLAETEYLVMLSRDLGYLAPQKAEDAITELSEIAGMLHALRRKVEGD